MFTINFRREAFARQRARERQRVIALALWLSYFGVLAVVIGLYGLNCTSTIRRAAQIERQAVQLRSLKLSGNPWHVAPAGLTQFEPAVTNPWLWRLRLEHLAHALPSSARLVSAGFNAQGQSGTPDAATFVIDGEIHTPPGASPVPAVMGIVAALHRDREFAAGFAAIRLRSTQAGAAGGAALFSIECR
jgi:hypothetical protein